MRRRLTEPAVALLVLLVGSALLGASGLPAQSTSQQGTSFNLEGKITEHTPGRLTVSTEDNIIFHVTYNEKTAIYRKDGSAGSPSDLKVGAIIKAAGELSPTGVVEASRIDME
ncbi:MAG: hypothetical protein ACRD2B_10090 [Terriglobia bacterium]